jgi:hypothetical protein
VVGEEVTAVKKGLVVGVAVGGLLYVMWRRRRAEAPPEPAPAWQPPPPPPEPVADAPAAAEAHAPAPVVPLRRHEAAPHHEEPVLHHPGRHVPLTSSGFASKPRPTAFRSSDRPQAAQARISWPGTGGAAGQRPKPLRLVSTRARTSARRRLH